MMQHLVDSMWVRAAVVLAACLAGYAGVRAYLAHTTPLQTLVVHAAPFVETVSVSGTVVAAQSVDLGFAQNGRIAHVYARVGDTVRAGTTIAEIENGDLRALVVQKQAALAQQEARLRSMQEGTRPEAIAVAQANLSSAQTAHQQSLSTLLNAVRDAYRAADDATRNKLDAFITNPRTVTPSLTFQTTDQTLQNTLLADRTSAESMLVSWEADLASLSLAADVPAAADQASTRLGTVAQMLGDGNAVLNHAIAGAPLSQSVIDGYIASIASARSAINAALTSLTAAQTAERSAAAAITSAQSSLTLAQAPATSADLAAQQAAIDAARADLSSAQAQLQKTLVVAPFAGAITRMDAKTGAIASPSVSQISLMSRTYQIEIYVPETRIADVRVGQHASTTIDAFGDESFAATVASVDPAATMKSGVSSYKVVVQFDTQDVRIRSGMSASVLIRTADIPDAITVPLGAVAHDAAGAHVRVLVQGVVSDRAVTVGGSAQGMVEITSGLSDGDVIVLQ